MKSKAFRNSLAILYLVALGLILYFAATGASYYSTPLNERPRHEDYWNLKPGGKRGHAFGIAGSVLMVAMLLYSVRKRVPGMRRFGASRLWLRFHIFCGIVGPLLIILHTSFKVQGLVALSFWSMIVVAVSGFVGRYLYVQMPRKRSGDELSLSEVEDLNRGLSLRLSEEFHLSEGVQTELVKISTSDIGRHRGLVRVFLGLPWEHFALRQRLRKFQLEVEGSSHELVQEMTGVIRQKATLERRIQLWSELHRLFYYWHVFHKPFAVIMYLFMIIHIVVAVATGYGGGFGE